MTISEFSHGQVGSNSSTDENPEPSSDPAVELSDEADQFDTYDQIKGILDQINGLNRSVVVSGIEKKESNILS